MGQPCLKQAAAIRPADAREAGDEASIARGGVGRRCLHRAGDGDVEHMIVVNLAGQLFRADEDAVDRRGFRDMRAAVPAAADLLDLGDIAGAGGKAVFEITAQHRIGHLAGQRSERLGDPALGVEKLAEPLDQKVVKRPDVF